MKQYFPFFLFFLGCCTMNGQDFVFGPQQKNLPEGPPHLITTEAEFHLQLVERYLSPLETLPKTPMGINGLGDEAALDISTILAKRGPFSVTETIRALDILHKAFEGPQFIQKEADRKPDKALQLLGVFQKTAVDQIVKERLAAETTFLTTLPKTIVPKPPPLLQPKPGVLPNVEDFKRGEPNSKAGE